MPSMLLTSYERMRRYLSDSIGTPLTDSGYTKRDIVNWISSVSSDVEFELNREFMIKSRTEYFDTKYSQERFYVAAPNIVSITSVKEDTEGLWDGGEDTYDTGDYFVGKDRRHVVIYEPIGQYKNAIQITYTGGLAYHGANSVFVLSGSTGTWTPNSFVQGGTSQAVGIIKSISNGVLTVENLYGIFSAGETLTEYTDELCATVGDASATLSSITSQSLAELYPDIVRAVEIEVRYRWKHKDSFDITSSQKDGTDYRRSGDSLRRPFTDEAWRTLSRYRRIVVL